MLSMTRNFFVLSLFCIFMHDAWLRVQSYECSVNKEFPKENDLLIQRQYKEDYAVLLIEVQVH